MPSDPQTQIEHIVADSQTEIKDRLPAWLDTRGPVEFRQLEQTVAQWARRLADGITSVILKHIVAQPKLQAAASVAARRQCDLRSGGRRLVKVTLHGGTRVRINTEYLRPDKRGKAARRARKGRGEGMYPALAALGIDAGVTPALGAEIARQVTDSDSVRAGRAALARRGIDLGHKQTLRIVNAFGTRAVEQRDRWLDGALAAPAGPGPLSGKRVAVAVDGGRLRERRPARRGRKRNNGHRRYDAPWVEPRLLTICVLDANGEVSDRYQPIYDGTLDDADGVFLMLLAYLKALGAHEAAQLIILGDGARWIWDRVGALIEDLGVDAARVVQVIDWSHAVSTLHEIADARRGWTTTQRSAWLRRAKHLLHAGRIEALAQAIDAIAVGRCAKDVREHREYFTRNAGRMQYMAFVAASIPTGSGMVESAIRRVINMRMKSNGMFWLEVNARGMLLLRSYLKAGHFDTLVDWSITQAVPWWAPAGCQRPATPYALTVAA
jgi:hypothetical protein